MTADIQQIKQSLEQELDGLQRRLRRIKTDVTQAHSSDSAEQAQERENDEVVDAIGQETRVAIHALRTALQRIEEGSYGQCEHCGEDIAEARLGAIPGTTLCIRCAD